MTAVECAPPVVIFVGHSGSGKTTLIEKLLPELTRRGLRLATIKHAHHRVALDQPGKDSWRYKQAGAALSMLVTADALQLVADAVDRRDPAQLAQRFLGEGVLAASRFTPTYWYVKATTIVTTANDLGSTDLTPVFTSMAVVLCFGAAFLALGLVVGKRRRTAE